MSSTPNSEPTPWNLPNAITAARILLVPVFLWVLFIYPNPDSMQRWWAVLLFVLTISTDGVDGAIARRRGLITNVGKILDPIADKALIGGALVGLSILGQIPWWVTILILVRELGITFFRFAVIRRKVIAASGGGKLKTVLQAVAIGFFLSPLAHMWGYWVEVLQNVVLYVALVITVYSGAGYLWSAFKVRGQN
jgi:CDP-diacylglycerol--glycerol-3-phosphate 3-phosphatidyltransferase